MANAQEFNAIQGTGYIGPVRQRAGYNIPVGYNPSTMGVQARSERSGFYPNTAMSLRTLIQAQSGQLYRQSASSNARKRGM